MRLPDVHPYLLTLLREGSMTGSLLPAPDEPAWENILRDATRQGLTLFLYQWSRESDRAASFPPSLGDQLKAEVARLTARNLALADELAAILRLCRDRALACAPLRGLALAEEVYPGLSLRPMGDIDLLVRREALPEVADLLRSLGYAEMDHWPGFAGTFSYTLEFVKDRHGWIVVEPHWTLAYPPFTDTIDMARVWERCRRGRVVGVETWLLSHEDLLVHLCFHILHQGHSAPLLWWYELGRLIRHTHATLNWVEVTAAVQQAGQELMVAEVLSALRSYFDFPIPPSVLARFAAAQTQQPSSSARKQVLNLLVTAPHLNGREEFAQFVTLQGLRAKVRYALSLLFPSPAHMIQRYELRYRAQLALWYPARLLSLCWDGLKWAGSLLCASFSAKPSPQQ